MHALWAILSNFSNFPGGNTLYMFVLPFGRFIAWLRSQSRLILKVAVADTQVKAGFPSE
jgi:hypothetical protein